MIPKAEFEKLTKKLDGDINIDLLYKVIYATDASVYRQIPSAVAYPKNKEDIKRLILFANNHKIGIIPRTAGTSLAGQCVGEGIIVDVSKYMTEVLDINPDEHSVTVEPGVIRDELNVRLDKYGLFFGPNTSTSNRCMIGGMVGNNSSGTTSIRYGVTRDKVKKLEVVLSDGSEAVFGEISEKEFKAKMLLKNLEGEVYRTLYKELKNAEQIVEREFPRPEIHRRNTGYAIDELIKTKPFNGNQKFNMCSLLTGSEGTLAFTTKITLTLDPLPPKHRVMVAAHFKSISDCCSSVVSVMKHPLYSCEMMDKVILDCTRNNSSHLQNRFFIEGDPEAILLLELRSADMDDLKKQEFQLLKTIKEKKIAYAYPSLYGSDIERAMILRKAGLGLLGNIVGDKKAVACIEDTAVALEDLSSYINDFSQLMNRYEQKVVYYAHAGAGELHLRPVLNLKKADDVALFSKITADVAKLVKKYHGSMSGEHGDGIVRSSFIEYMIGSELYQKIKSIKKAFDPLNIMNPGKIVDFKPIDQNLRYVPERKEPEVQTFMDFSDSQGILRAVEKCNGSGDCRKTHISKGVMCPSYHVTKNEKDTTRARANALREFITNSDKTNRFDHDELKEVFDLCLSCKACSSECPSSVDIAAIKSEFLYQYKRANGSTFRDKAFANNIKFNKTFSRIPWLFNTILNTAPLKNLIGITNKRRLPKMRTYNFSKHLNSYNKEVSKETKILLFIDEFTHYHDTEVGKDAISLLRGLGYDVDLYFGDSGRSFISKGFLEQAQQLAKQHTSALKGRLSEKHILVGLEPSSVLTFRDEFIRLSDDKDAASSNSRYVYLIEEFLASEVKKGIITTDEFHQKEQVIKIHNHCHQKALSTQKVTFTMLNLPVNYEVSIMNTGCCGMAGSFGYEKEHYDLSIQLGELSLFPKVRKAEKNVLIAANGTSCRHQIFDGTGRSAQHPVSILYNALN